MISFRVCAEVIAPFQGLEMSGGLLPRALPWAMIWRPFRAWCNPVYPVILSEKILTGGAGGRGAFDRIYRMDRMGRMVWEMGCVGDARFSLSS